MIPLTPELAKIKAAIVHLSRDGVAPSYAEIQREVGVGSRSAIHGALHLLRDRGHIDFQDRIPRTIRVIGELEGLGSRSTQELRALRNNIDTILKERGL